MTLPPQLRRALRLDIFAFALVAAALLACPPAWAENAPATSGFATAKQAKIKPAASKQLRRKVIARVNGEAVFQDAFDTALAKALGEGAADSGALREAIKRELIARKLLVQAAQRKKLWDDPAVIRAHEDALIARYMQLYAEPVAVTDDDVLQHFERSNNALGPFEYKLRSMALRDEASAHWALGQLQTGNADFAQLAKKISRSPNAASGGTMAWLAPPLLPQSGGGVPAELVQAISELQIGEIAGPIHAGSLYLLFKLEGKRETVRPKFDPTIEKIIREKLQAENLARAVTDEAARLMKEARVEVIKNKGD